MKRKIGLMLGLAALLVPLTLIAQVQNEGLANGVIAARKKNATLMQTYTWNCRTDVQENGATQDLRIDLVTMLPGGTLQKSLLNDQQGALPGGFLRKAIEENKRKQLEKYVSELAPMVDHYTLGSAGAVINFLASAQVQPVSTPDGKTILNINGNNVVAPGDTFGMTVDGRTLQPLNVNVSTTYNNDPITIQASFITMKSGLNHLQYATVSVPGKNLVIMIHNYDYVPNQ